MSRPDVAGRLQKWSIMLAEHNITYRPRTSIKRQILADFLNEIRGNTSQGVPVAVTQEKPWTLFTDGSLCVDGSGAGLILTIPEGVEFTYVLRFRFAASNNEAEYEALVAGLRIATQMGVKTYKQTKGSDSSDRGKGPTWMTELANYLKEGILPEDEKGARKLHLKARQYELIEGVLYKRSFHTPWLRCVGPLQAEYVMREIHEGSCSMHAGPRPLSRRARKGKILDSRNGLLHEVDRRKGSGNDYQRAGEEICMGQYCMPLRKSKQKPGEGIKARLGEGNKNWVEELPHVLWAHRTMIKSSHGDTPFSLTYRTEAVIPADIKMPTYRTVAVDAVNNDEELRLNLDLLEERRELAAMSEAKSNSKMMKYYNARVYGVAFKPGDFVYRINDASHAVAGGKLGPKWEGPYEVTDALGNGTYKLRSTDETVLSRTWNVTNLKRCYL
nr:hypothetical protein [Tanacetum cinerariifolium]